MISFGTFVRKVCVLFSRVGNKPYNKSRFLKGIALIDELQPMNQCDSLICAQTKNSKRTLAPQARKSGKHDKNDFSIKFSGALGKIIVFH